MCDPLRPRCEWVKYKLNQQFDIIFISGHEKAQIEYEGCGCEIVEMEIVTVELTHVWS